MKIKKIILSIQAIIYVFVGQCNANVSQRPLKILFMLHRFPAFSATFIMGQITGFIDKGHDVSIFARTKLSEQKIHPDVERYKLLDKTYYRYLPEDILSYDILYCQFFSLAKRLLPEIIQLKKQSQKPPKFVVACCGSDGIENVIADNKRYDQLFEYTDLFLPVCELFKNYLLQAGCSSEKIIVHYPAIDTAKFQYKERELLPDRDIILLSIGRLVETKGFEYGIHAFAQLEKEFSQLRYVILGDGSQRKKLETLINNYGLSNKIHLLGWCSQDQIVSWLGKAHILVHPSITSSGNCQEGIPNVLLEAMATGLPVVSTLHGGIPELIEDGISGFLVSEKNIAILYKKVKYLIGQLIKYCQIGKRGRITIENKYNIKIINQELEFLFYNCWNSNK